MSDWHELTVAAGQFRPGSDVASNLASIESLTARATASGAQIIALPELAMIDPLCSMEAWASAAETIDGSFVTALQILAQENSIAIACGMLETDGNDRFNTVVAIDRDGTLAGRYRKIHLFDAHGVRESDRVSAPDIEPCVVTLCGAAIGVLTCYDIRFPELGRALVDRGAEIFVIPAAWYAGVTKLDQWQSLTSARAIENTVYVIASDQVTAPFVGSSRVLTPGGAVLADAGDNEFAVAVATLRRADLDATRLVMPSLRHRRM